MYLVIKLKAGTTLAQADEMFDELTDSEGWGDLIENARIQPGEQS